MPSFFLPEGRSCEQTNGLYKLFFANNPKRGKRFFCLFSFAKTKGVNEQKMLMRKGVKRRVTKEPVKIVPVILLMLYGLVTVIVPDMKALDANGPKFMALSFLNILVYFYIFFIDKAKTKTNPGASLLKNILGITYSVYIVISLLSFVKSINVPESILHFSKIFTSFVSAVLVSILLKRETRGILYLSIFLSCLLIVDSIIVFEGISRYIEGRLNSISDIKSFYSNKNILTAAIFVKIPFALGLIFRAKTGFRILGFISFFCAQLSVWFMSTRAFYLGSFILVFLFVFFLVIRYLQTRQKMNFRLAIPTVLLFLLSILTVTSIQNNLYPKKEGRQNNLRQNLSSINTEESSAKARLDSWKRSVHLIRDNPLLGVGAGNWKLTSLKEENRTKNSFILMYKNHNDFIENTAETGIPGGILYLSLFIICFWFFGRAVFKNAPEDELTTWFLCAFGLLAYSFDAFFNFPQDRAEIALLFALYLGIAMGILEYLPKPAQKMGNYFHSSFLTKVHPSLLKYGTRLLVVAFLFGTSFVLFLNYRSLVTQRIVFAEINNGKLISPSEKIISGLPCLPNLSAVGEPIAVNKARYLITEKKYDEAIALLIKDQSSPWDSRREFFLYQAYLEQDLQDSALVYCEQAHMLKPNFFLTLQDLCRLLPRAGRYDEAEEAIDNYLLRNKKNSDAWLLGYHYLISVGKLDKAITLLDSASFYISDTKKFEKAEMGLGFAISNQFYDDAYESAIQAYNEGKFDVAVQLLSLILESEADCDECRIKRAFSYYSLREYAKSNKDLEFLISKGVIRPNMFNLLGVNYFFLNDREKACIHFRNAMNMGDKQGKINYEKYCSN